MNLTATLLVGIALIVLVPHLILNYVLWLPVYIQVVIHVPLAALYYVWVPSEWKDFRSWPGWSLLRDDYLKITYHGPGRELLLPRDKTKGKEEEDAPHKQLCFGVHPHGVHATALMFGFALNPAIPECRVFGTSLLFRIPLVKELVGWGGTVKADKERVLFEMESGNNVALAPGGLAEVPGLVPEWTDDPRSKEHPYPPESEYYRNWRIRGVVHGRGFLRYAQTASREDRPVHVVPIWVQGEEELYDVWLPLPKIQRWLLRTRLRYPWPIFARGHRWFFFWPKRSANLCIWAGEPIDISDMKLRDAEDAFYDALDKLRSEAIAYEEQ